jgi:hypothetical protein
VLAIYKVYIKTNQWRTSHALPSASLLESINWLGRCYSSWPPADVSTPMELLLCCSAAEQLVVAPSFNYCQSKQMLQSLIGARNSSALRRTMNTFMSTVKEETAKAPESAAAAGPIIIQTTKKNLPQSPMKMRFLVMLVRKTGITIKIRSQKIC